MSVEAEPLLNNTQELSSYLKEDTKENTLVITKILVVCNVK
jgi:hypothetical protein